MANKIKIVKNGLSAKTLDRSRGHAKTALKTLDSVASGRSGSLVYAKYAVNGQRFGTFSSEAIGAVSEAFLKLYEINDKLERLAEILGTGPDDIERIDDKYKNDLTSWGDRLNYNMTSWIGKDNYVDAPYVIGTSSVVGTAEIICRDEDKDKYIDKKKNNKNKITKEDNKKVEEVKKPEKEKVVKQPDELAQIRSNILENVHAKSLVWNYAQKDENTGIVYDSISCVWFSQEKLKKRGLLSSHHSIDGMSKYNGLDSDSVWRESDSEHKNVTEAMQWIVNQLRQKDPQELYNVYVGGYNVHHTFLIDRIWEDEQGIHILYSDMASSPLTFTEGETGGHGLPMANFYPQTESIITPSEWKIPTLSSDNMEDCMVITIMIFGQEK